MDGSRKKAALVVFLFVHEPLHRNRAVVLYRQSIFWCYVFVAGSPQPPPKWSNESHSVTLAAMCRGELCWRSNLCTSAPNRSNMRSTPTWPLAAAWCIAVRPWQHEAKHTTVKTAHLSASAQNGQRPLQDLGVGNVGRGVVLEEEPDHPSAPKHGGVVQASAALVARGEFPLVHGDARRQVELHLSATGTNEIRRPRQLPTPHP